MRKCLVPMAVALVLGRSAAAQGPLGARVWDSTLTLPSYAEGAPDPNPPFDLFGYDGRPDYPYTIRDRLTDHPVARSWRAIWLENDYLRCAVLPELGGHLYTCTDRINGQSLFYDNTTIKLAAIAYRGSWAAFGVEFNFPVSHNWVTTSPVDVAWGAESDGSAWVAVGNVDRPYGMQWTVWLVLRPGRALLEQHTTLYNRSGLRRRFYWWTNAGVRVGDDSRILYPMRFTASHGFTDVDTWPVDRRGTDNSVVGNHRFGPVSRFAHGSREPFMAVWHPSRQAGIAHYSSPSDLPAKKIWSWGRDADGLDWRRALSDDSSAYVEIQAGLFRDQETYAYLQPHEAVRFTEYWVPIRGLGGLTRATPDAALNLWREADSVRLALNVTRVLSEATVEMRGESGVLTSRRASLRPEETVRAAAAAGPGPVTVTVLDRAGRVLLRHTEGRFDWLPDSLMHAGAQAHRAMPQAAQRSEGDWLEAADGLERDGYALGAMRAYDEALRRFPASLPLLRGAGRLAVVMMQYVRGDSMLGEVHSRMPTDYEASYYLGLARIADGDTGGARALFEEAQQFGPLRPAAAFELAALEARSGDPAAAESRLARAGSEQPLAVRLRAAAVFLARTQGATDRALERLRQVRGADPTNLLLRLEAVRLGGSDEGLWRALAADPERILELALEYARFGLYADALDLLARDYPTDGVVGEPGAVRPERYPLIAYVRGWVRERAGGQGREDLAAASRMPATYVFPNRPEEFTVLARALAVNPDDATAWHLLGELQLCAGMLEGAIASWRRAAALNPAIPTLHRNLGYALLAAARPLPEARAVFEAGVRYDSLNGAVLLGLDSVLALGGAGPGERADVFARYPRPDSMSVALVFREARLLARAGRFDDAERLLRNRYFPRREGGTNVREVWLEVRVARAEALAAQRACAEARRVVDTLARPVAGLPFTRDGLEPFLQGEFANRVAQVRVACGR